MPVGCSLPSYLRAGRHLVPDLAVLRVAVVEPGSSPPARPCLRRPQPKCQLFLVPPAGAPLTGALPASCNNGATAGLLLQQKRGASKNGGNPQLGLVSTDDMGEIVEYWPLVGSSLMSGTVHAGNEGPIVIRLDCRE